MYDIKFKSQIVLIIIYKLKNINTQNKKPTSSTNGFFVIFNSIYYYFTSLILINGYSFPSTTE